MRPSASDYSHVAFADESSWNHGRYRSVALLTAERDHAVALHTEVEDLLRDSEIRGIKWKKVRGARYRRAAVHVLDATVDFVARDRGRVDVVIWDTHDSRHRIRRRDDVANLERMYFHVLRNVFDRRWPDGATWGVYPDRQEAADWDESRRILDQVGSVLEPEANLWQRRGFQARVRESFRIKHIEQAASARFPLVQLADLFAGMGSYSYERYDRIRRWQMEREGQAELFDASEGIELSNADEERCHVLQALLDRCASSGLTLSIQSHQGLWTPNPSTPMNFWPYAPQRPEDKAPVRQ